MSRYRNADSSRLVILAFAAYLGLLLKKIQLGQINARLEGMTQAYRRFQETEDHYIRVATKP